VWQIFSAGQPEAQASGKECNHLAGS
jgi:hypothetical protein